MNLQPNKTDGIYLPLTNTRISASEWNQLVGSCMAFIYAAGFSPDAADNEQFLNAFKKIASELELVGANTALSNLTSAGQGKFDAKVSKTGDTMTGQLEMAGTGTSAIKLNVTNVTDKFKDIAAYNGDDRFAGLRLEYTGQSSRVAGLYACDTNSNISQLRIYYDSNNNVITSAPACDNANSILTTVAIKKAETGHVKLGNGMILQWGVVSHGYDARKTVTLGYPFGNTNYKVFLTNYNTGASSAANAMAYTVYAKDSTSFSFFASRLENKSTGTQYAYYFAIGY